MSLCDMRDKCWGISSNPPFFLLDFTTFHMDGLHEMSTQDVRSCLSNRPVLYPSVVK